VKDDGGGIWGFSTCYSEYTPSDPDFFAGKTIGAVTLRRSGELTMHLTDGTKFKVIPEPEEPDDELPTWRLFTPDGLVLRFRPRGHWDLVRASDPV
jgi:hypothetical protein